MTKIQLARRKDSGHHKHLDIIDEEDSATDEIAVNGANRRQTIYEETPVRIPETQLITLDPSRALPDQETRRAIVRACSTGCIVFRLIHLASA